MRTAVSRLLFVLVAGLACPGLIAGASSPPGAAPPASPEGSPMASPAASPVAGAVVEIAIVDYGFDSETVEIPAGTTVTWTNTGGVIHTTSHDELWDSGILNTGESFSYTFTAPGTYGYGCALHPKMLATIVVTEP